MQYLDSFFLLNTFLCCLHFRTYICISVICSNHMCTCAVKSQRSVLIRFILTTHSPVHSAPRYLITSLCPRFANHVHQAWTLILSNGGCNLAKIYIFFIPHVRRKSARLNFKLDCKTILRTKLQFKVTAKSIHSGTNNHTFNKSFFIVDYFQKNMQRKNIFYILFFFDVRFNADLNNF